MSTVIENVGREFQEIVFDAQGHEVLRVEARGDGYQLVCLDSEGEFTVPAKADDILRFD